jgi:copper chaperone CopZ
MRTGFVLITAVIAFLFFGVAETARSAENPPHTPTLVFYLTGLQGKPDVAAIGSEIQKLKSATVIEVNTDLGYARIRFDSHVVSYHQVAQAVVDAGKTLKKVYNPYLIFTVPDYGKADNAAKVDRIFAGKRLNQRVHVTPLDKGKGIFAVHFLPLTVDPSDASPQGFNGGHLHHPISDPTPRGLGLPSGYASDYDPALARGAEPTTAASAQ